MKTLLGALFASAIASTSVAANATMIELNFDEPNIKHGTIIDDEYAQYGVSISGHNPSEGHDIATAYDVTPKRWNNEDPDLTTPWDGGNVARNYDAGNILILQESTKSCNQLVCKRPDDEGSRPAGSLIFDFDYIISSLSFDLIDIERPETSGAAVNFFDSNNNLLGSTAFASFNEADFGDNHYNAIDTIDLKGLGSVTKVEFAMGGSGGLNNVRVSSVPEIDGAGAALALGLLGALAAIRRERRRSA